MDQKRMLRALALAGAVTGASIIASGGAVAAPTKWNCKDELPPGSSFERWHCGYSQFPLRAPNIDVVPNVNPNPGPSPGPYST
ncbi:hypothetical protein [Aestuariivirga sp.]|uniref:hypothetical protein n=1 Tax=Aestuariivirga sp. TaxID=2650926 RepID=UPI0035B036C5